MLIRLLKGVLTKNYLNIIKYKGHMCFVWLFYLFLKNYEYIIIINEN